MPLASVPEALRRAICSQAGGSPRTAQTRLLSHLVSLQRVLVKRKSQNLSLKGQGVVYLKTKSQKNKVMTQLLPLILVNHQQTKKTSHKMEPILPRTNCPSAYRG